MLLSKKQNKKIMKKAQEQEKSNTTADAEKNQNNKVYSIGSTQIENTPFWITKFEEKENGYRITMGRHILTREKTFQECEQWIAEGITWEKILIVTAVVMQDREEIFKK